MSDPRYFLAAERTFLAWIRTGVALMGLGFVVARFGLFLREIQVNQTNLSTKTYGLSFWFGTAFILLGVIVNVASAWNHVRIIGQIERGESSFNRPSALAITIAVLVAIVGLVMAVYLVSVR